MAGSRPVGVQPLTGDNPSPPLGEMKVALYRAGRRNDEAVDMLMAELRCAYGC